MKISPLFFAALLGLSVSGSAYAQTTVPGAAGTMATPGATVAPGTVPGQPGNGSLPNGTLSTGTTPVGTAPSTIYAPGNTPSTINGMGTGTLNSTQPVPAGTNPTTRSTRRTTTGSRTTTTRP